MAALKKRLSWCKTPFTYGNAMQTERVTKTQSFHSDSDVGALTCPVRDVSFNGMVASIQMLIVLVTMSFAVTLSVYLSVDFDGTINMLVLIVYMLSGLVVAGVFSFRRDRFVVPRYSRVADEPRKDNLALIGITIFYILGCLLDMFHAVASTNCDGVWKDCHDKYIYVSYGIEVLFHVMRIAYLGGETLFCVTFHKSTFADRPSTRYGLMFLQAANLSLWFDALVHESAHKFISHPRTSRFLQRCLANRTNVTGEVLGCVYHNSSIYKMTDNIISPIFLPFTIEFTLLAGECLCHWFFHCAFVLALENQSTAYSNTTDGGPASPVSENDMEDYADQQISNNNLPNGVLPQEVSDFANQNDQGIALLETSSSRLESTIVPNVLTIVIITSNAVLWLLAVLHVVDTAHYGQAFNLYVSSFWVCMILSIFVGYYISRSFKYATRSSFNGLDYLLLLTSIGPLGFDTFTIIAAVGIPGHVNSTDWGGDGATSAFPTIHLELSNALEVYFQVAFGLFAGRVVVDGKDSTRRPMLFRCIVLFLAVSNGSFWLIGSFNVFDKGQPLQESYFGTNGWAVVSNIVVPLSLFFRFNGCLLFTRVFLRLRKKDEGGENQEAERRVSSCS